MEFELYRERAIVALNQSVKFDGFRPGQAPEAVLGARLGEAKILETMAELALKQRYPKILAENHLDAIGQPTVQITKLAKGNPLGFKITTAIYPKFTLPDYRTLTKPLNNQPTETIEVTAKEIDGVIAQAEKQGKQLGRDEIRIHLERQKVQAAKDKHRLKILDALLALTTIVVPNILLEVELDKILQETKASITSFGGNFDDYLTQAKKTEADLRQEWRTGALKRVQANLLLGQIAQAEKIQAPAEAIEKETRAFLNQNKERGVDAERVRAYFAHLLTTALVWEFLETQK